MTTWIKQFFALGFLLLAFPLAQAETLYLHNGKEIRGHIDQIHGGFFLVTTPDGKKWRFERSEIARISFETPQTAFPKNERPSRSVNSEKITPKDKSFLSTLAPKASSIYATPLDTFHVWQQAAKTGDIDSMVKCYVSYRQQDMKKRLKKIKRKDRNRMRESTAQTEFIPSEPYYRGDRASLEVNWRNGVHGDSQILQFALEGNDWKIVQ